MDPLRFCLLGILFAVFLSGGRRVYGQDVDSLLAQLSVHDPAAKGDLIRLGPAVFPKLLDYAINKKDPLLSKNAIYAISLLPESSIDVRYLTDALLNGNDRDFAVESLEVLGHRAKPAESQVIIFLTRPKTEYHTRLAFVVGRMGIESTHHLFLTLGSSFNPTVLSALSTIEDRDSFHLLAQSIKTNNPLPAKWAIEALRIITEDQIAGKVPPRSVTTNKKRARHIPLRDPDEEVPGIQEIYSVELAPLFVDCLNYSSCRYREVAALGLGLSSKTAENYVALLNKTLSDSNSSVRLAAAISLVKLTEKVEASVQSVLVSGLDDQSIERRQLATEFLVKYAPTAAGLEKALNDTDKHTRWTAAKAFSYGRNGEPAMDVFAEMIAEDKDETEGTQGLSHVGDPALPLIEHLLDDPRPKVRNGALETLYFIKKTEATKRFIPRVLAMVGNPDVRNEAILALSSLADSTSFDAITQLMSALRDQATDSFTREMVFDGLARIGHGDARIIPFLSQIVRSTRNRSYAQSLSEIDGVNDEILASISFALADSANEIPYTWLVKIHSSLSEYWSREFFSTDVSTRTNAQKLIIAYEPEKALDRIIAGIQDQRTQEASLIQLASLLKSDPETEESGKVRDQMNVTAVNWLAGKDTSLQRTAVRALIIAHGLHENSWSVCRGEFGNQTDIEPTKELLSRREQVIPILLRISDSDEDLKNRIRAAVLMETLGVDNSHLRSLLGSGINDPDEFVHLFALSFAIRSNLIKSGDTVRLIQQRSGFSKTSRQFGDADCAIEALENVKNEFRPDATRSFTALLSSKNAGIRLKAATALIGQKKIRNRPLRYSDDWFTHKTTK